MVSEWMVNGSISKFVKVHADADRLKLVGFYISRFLSSLVTDDYMITVAERRHQGVDSYTRPGNNPWEYRGGAC